RTGQTFGSAWQTSTYSFANSFPYVQIRLQITANNGDAMTEVGELQLFDSNPCLPESDAVLCASYGKNCGSGAVGICSVPYAQSSCFAYQLGTQVSRNGHNWTCSSGNCMNCAGNASC